MTKKVKAYIIKPTKLIGNYRIAYWETGGQGLVFTGNYGLFFNSFLSEVNRNEDSWVFNQEGDRLVWSKVGKLV